MSQNTKNTNKTVFQYATKTAGELMDAFAVTHGITQEEIAQRQLHYGKNVIENQTTTVWQILLRQIKSPFIYMLAAAAALSFVLGEVIDGTMVLVIILLNTGLGFFQEHRSEKSLRLLSQYVMSYAKVIRGDKQQSIPCEELVPGDIVILETGDKIPADVRFLQSSRLLVDESILTGESAPVEKTSDPVAKEPKEIFDARNLGFSGTAIIDGKARALVVATGTATVIGDIAHLTASTHRVSDFQKGISRFSAFIFRLVMITLVIVLAVNIIVKHGHIAVGDLVLFAIALAVGVLPEALPVVTTFSLSHGALRLAKEKVVVKRLSAIEDLGGIEILCTDKTGTITENKLTVDELSPNASTATLYFANAGTSTLGDVNRDPFDIALWNALPVAEQQKLSHTHRVADIPFNPVRRRNTVMIHGQTGYDVIVRGAPEVVIDLCSNVTTEKRASLDEWIAEKGEQGRRVLAIATTTAQNVEVKKVHEKLEIYEHDLTLLGVVSFIDPIKASTFDAVRQAHLLGVKIKILTGDNREVAGTVAAKIGLVQSPRHVLTGAEMELLHGDALHHAIEDNSVFARVSPQQKYRIIQHLQEKYSVGFLGEGINDAPALKVAGVSLAVSNASDITREAADIMLLKKDLKVIINGIQEGRAVFANTVKYIKATLASNFGNFYSVALVSLFIPFLPMLPLQILLLNLLSDFPMITIATDHVDAREIAQPRRYNVRDIAFIATLLGLVSTTFDFIFFGIFYNGNAGRLQTNWFILSILTELALLFSIRTMRFFLSGRRPSGPVLAFTGIAAVVALTIPFTPLGDRFFDFIKPQPHDVLVIVGLVALYFISSEIVKLLYMRFFSAEKV